MKFYFIFLLYLISSSTACFSQLLFQNRISNKGNIELAPLVNIPMDDKGYSLWLPKNTKAIGLVVFFHGEWDSLPDNKLRQLCFKNNLGIVYLSTGNRFELLNEDQKLQELHEYLQTILTKHKISSENLLFAGMSLEGTRALRMALFELTSSNKNKLLPAAIAICDSPLDMVRFHESCVRAYKLNAHPAAANEGYWVSNYLESRIIAGSPEKESKLIQYSPFSHAEDSGGNAKHFLKNPIRAYTEPDVQWWMENRSKDYYDMNSIDMAGLINSLRISGNKNAELILTTNKGYLPDGTRHPHSWSIVDEEELIIWFLRIIGDSSK